MGVYKAAVVTENGQHLIAQAFTSEKKLIFTSAKTSSYSYPAGTNISALTGLQDVVQSVIPSGTKTIGGNVAQVTVRFDNDSIDQAYLIQTIGLYAKIEDREETLFSVTQATVPDEMPVHSEVSPSAYIYNIQSTVQNASQITITVNPTGAASVQDFLDIQNPAFDDSGTSEEISSFPEFLDTVKSKMNFFQFFRNLKAGLQFVLHVGSIVNNCVTDNPNLPLSAAQGKALQDQLATLNSNLTRKYYSINSQGSEPILEVYGNICALQYCDSIWTSSDHIPSGFYPKILSGIWTPVSSSDDLNAANEYRLCIQNNGAVVLQKNGINISDNTSIRGQAIWII